MHIPAKYNEWGDSLSRLQVQEFQKLAAHAHLELSVVPEALMPQNFWNTLKNLHTLNKTHLNKVDIAVNMFKIEFSAWASINIENDRILGKQLYSKGICNYLEIRYGFKHAENRPTLYSCLICRNKKK